MSHEQCTCEDCQNLAVLDIVEIMQRFQSPGMAMSVLMTAFGFATSVMCDGDIDKARYVSKTATNAKAIKAFLVAGDHLRQAHDAALALVERSESTQH